jgi:L-fuculose-phosphate aldolase
MMRMAARADIIREIVDVCRRLADNHFVAATDGNVSARLSCGHILTTRTAINKGMVTESDLVEVNAEGTYVAGEGRPSTELGMHLYIYHERPDVQAVVHAHPVTATGFATARIPLDDCLFPEVIVGLGAVPLAAYATPSTSDVAASLAPFVRTANAILLANHGVVTYGSSLREALFAMEKVEHTASVAFIARMLGGARTLTSDELERLRTISVGSYGKDFSEKIACIVGPRADETLSEADVRAYVEQKLRNLRIIDDAS